MRAHLVFNLPEDREAFQDAQDGTMLRAQLDQVFNIFRKHLKHGDLKPAEYKILEQVREEIRTELYGN